MKSITTRRILLIILSITLPLLTFAQTFNLKGRVTDSLQRPLPGATVFCKNNTSGKIEKTTTNTDGYFQFNLPKGEYEIHVEFVGFTSFKKIFALAGDNTQIAVTLKEQNEELQRVNVFSKINGETESSSRTAEKNANNITNVISSQAMQRSPDINAANVLQRMSGVTLQKNSGADESYAIVRGLEPRYNNTLINGVKVTSPDEKSRYVSLDIVPSDLLQKIEISKSLLPDMESDAIGACTGGAHRQRQA